jgi:hypothetical protein
MRNQIIDYHTIHTITSLSLLSISIQNHCNKSNNSTHFQTKLKGKQNKLNNTITTISNFQFSKFHEPPLTLLGLPSICILQFKQIKT